MAVHTRWRHQRGKAGYEFGRREVQLVGLCPVLCTSLCVALVVPLAAKLDVLLGAAVDQLAARFAQPRTSKRWPCAVTQQALQARAVLRRYAHAGVHRKPAVHVAMHLLGLETLKQTAPQARKMRLRKAACAWVTVSALTPVAGWKMMRGGSWPPATSSNTPSTTQT